MSEKCPCCHFPITEENPKSERLCPKCETVMCESCDMGAGCACVRCDSGENDG